MTNRFATIILAGGKGRRMGSRDKHKVCFEALGTPVIVRALETYTLCGSSLTIVVVGMLAEEVMATVNQRFPGTAYAFQETALGTGDAARKGAEILDRMRFDGNVLVVAGDKIIEPHVIRGMLTRHQATGSDLTIATTARRPGSSAGIILRNRRGTAKAILETHELNRLLAITALADMYGDTTALPCSRIRKELARRLPDNQLKNLVLWKAASESGRLSKRRFISLTSEQDRRGLIAVGKTVRPVHELMRGELQENQSTYIFRAPVLYEALHALTPSRAGQEEYLTDVVGILSSRKRSARIATYEINDPEDLMAFNNPEELIAVEEVLRRRQGGIKVAPACPSPIAPASQWSGMLRNPTPAARRMFRRWYGADIPWDAYLQVLDAFIRRHGPDRKASIIRSPGRINLLGRHIDHQGGSVNVMAINREIIMVAAPRDDDVVSLSNTAASLFGDHTFRISDMVAQLDWDDWLHAVDGPRIRRILEAARGDWYNYVKAAVLRLQEKFRHQRLNGMDVMVAGNIPTGAGLSSSSALVVATAEAVSTFNRLGVTARSLVSLCGEGEWFVGTRGGAADHAAIKLSRRGYVTRVGFFPFRVEQAAPFFKDHDLVVCNSGIYAGKSGKARHIFNQKVTAYHIGRIYVKMLRPDVADRIEHLRDIAPERLNIGRAAFFDLLARIPSHMTRAEVRAALRQAADAERESVERLFDTHTEPVGGYTVRDVVLFGLSEMERAKGCLNLLRAGDAAGLGRLMDISHDGDRLCRANNRGKWVRSHESLTAAQIADIGRRRGRKGRLGFYPGAYACSLPQLDRITDTARALPGVQGAQMAGAGLGGCVMALVEKTRTSTVIERLAADRIQAEVFHPIAGATSLALV